MSARKSKAPRVIIRVDGGNVTVVAKPKGIELEIRDYDLQEVKNGTKLDGDGDIYEEQVYS